MTSSGTLGSTRHAPDSTDDYRTTHEFVVLTSRFAAWAKSFSPQSSK